MKNKRILSWNSKQKIYHKPGCPYANRIKSANYMELPLDSARKAGYRSCKYCNSMKHQYTKEKYIIEEYEKNDKVEIKLDKENLYIKTKVGCWKLVYSKRNEDMNVYHRNTVNMERDFEGSKKDFYHRQKDFPYIKSIHAALNYIVDHDKYREAEKTGNLKYYRIKPKYKKAVERNKRRHERQRLENLFEMIELENKNLKKASIC